MPRIEKKQVNKNKASNKKMVTIIWSITSALLVAVIVLGIVLGVKAYNKSQEVEMLDTNTPDIYLADYQVAKTDSVLVNDLIEDNSEVFIFAYHGSTDFTDADADGTDEEKALYTSKMDFLSLIESAKNLYDSSKTKDGIIVRFVDLDVSTNSSLLSSDFGADFTLDDTATCTLMYFKDGEAEKQAKVDDDSIDSFDVFFGNNYKTTKSAITKALDYLAAL